MRISNISFQLPAFLLGLLVTLAALDGAESLAAPDAKSLNERAWDENLGAVANAPAAAYGFYAYRSLAVTHPEVYLEADRFVADVLEGMPGSRLAYRSHNARDIELFLRLARRETKGGTFSLGMTTLTPDSIYDTQSPRSSLDWLVLRAPSIAVILKSHSAHLTTLDAALLRYAQLTRSGHLSADAFVVVDRKGAGYLATDTTLWLAGLSNRAVKNWQDISPVLVFNRRAVFSAISGRDDRERDSALTVLMSRLDSPAKLSMESSDRDRAVRISQATALSDSTSRRLALLIASGLADRNQPNVNEAWSDSLLGELNSTNCRDLLLEEALFWGNRLSPKTAQLAAGLIDRPRAEAFGKIQEEYLSWAGRRVSPDDSNDTRTESWGCIWSYDLLQTGIDDNIMTRAGSSVSQASAMSAALDLAGVAHFQLGVRMGDKQIPDQQWLFADNGKYQFNLGIWTTVPDSLPQGARPTTLLITGFSIKGRSVRIGSGYFCSRMDDLAVGEHLSTIARQIPLATLALTVPSGEVTPFQKFLVELTGDHYQPVTPLWPHAPTP